MSCAPGPNWGGGSGNRGGGGGSASSQQMGLELMQEMTTQMMNSMDEAEAERKKRAEQAKQRAREKRAAEEREKLRHQEEKFERLSEELKFDDNSAKSELSLKLGDDDPALKPRPQAPPNKKAMLIAEQNMKVLNCQLATAYEMFAGMGAHGAAETKELRQNLEEVREDLSQPPSGRTNTQKIYTRSLHISDTEGDGGRETIVEILVERHEDTGRVFLSVMYKGFKSGQHHEGDLAVYVDKNGKVENLKKLPPSLKKCLRN